MRAAFLASALLIAACTTTGISDVEPTVTVAAGADVIFGHHQHRLNPLGWVDGAPVAWGLGNFIWPRITVPSATTANARVIVHPDGQMGACLIPVEIVSHGHPEFTGEPAGYCVPLYDGEPWSGTDTSDAD